MPLNLVLWTGRIRISLLLTGTKSFHRKNGAGLLFGITQLLGEAIQADGVRTILAIHHSGAGDGFKQEEVLFDKPNLHV